MYNKPLFDYPGVLLFWDILALCASVTLVVSALVAAWHHNENTFPILVKAGMVPLLCFASHAHYILIAWITDPFYATSVGIYYGICYIIHLLVFKKTYTAVYHLTDTRCCRCCCCCLSICKNGEKKIPVVYFNWKAMCTAFGVLVIALCYQALITVFIVYVPINNAIENTPSRLFIAIQSVGALLLGLLAYKIIAGKESLSIIIGAIRNVIKVQPEFCSDIDTKKWNRLGNEEKFAEVLRRVFKTHVDGSNTSTTNPPVSATTAPVSATTATVSATTAPVSATTATVSATTATVSATTAPVSATTAPVSATTAPVSATTATVSATTATVSATTAPVSATTAPVSATTAHVSATTAPVSATTAHVSTPV